MRRRFCVNCGAEEAGGVYIVDNLCIKCYIDLKREIIKIPSTIEINVCSRCGAILISGKWYYPELAEEAKEIVEKYIALEVKSSEDVSILGVDVDVIPPSYREARVIVKLLIKNRYSYTIESKVGIAWIKKLCPKCFQRAGKSFEAVVQVRFMHIDESAEKFKREIIRLFQDYVVDVEDLDGGYDIKVSSQGIARKIADMAKKYWRAVKVVESFGNVKRTRGGARYAKLYLSIRVVNPRVGDYVILEGKAYTITRVGSNDVTVADSSGFEKSIPFDELRSAYERSKTRRGASSYSL